MNYFADAKNIIISVFVVILICTLGFMIHSYNSAMKENASLKINIETLKDDIIQKEKEKKFVEGERDKQTSMNEDLRKSLSSYRDDIENLTILLNERTDKDELISPYLQEMLKGLK